MKLKFPLLSCRFIIGFVLQVSFRVIEPNFLIRFQYKGFQVFQFPNVINVLIWGEILAFKSPRFVKPYLDNVIDKIDRKSSLLIVAELI